MPSEIDYTANLNGFVTFCGPFVAFLNKTLQNVTGGRNERFPSDTALEHRAGDRVCRRY